MRPEGGKANISDVALRSVEARERIAEHIYRTPLFPSRSTGAALGCDLRFKAENFQLTGSFKMRGAASKMSSLPKRQRLITASSGNHGIASSRAARRLDQDLTVVLPENVSSSKLNKIKSFGVEVVLEGAESGAAEKHAQRLAASGAYQYISPYNDQEVIAGQGTIGLELLEDIEGPFNVFISMGGGGLISGIGAVLKHANSAIRVIGVAAENSAALAAALEQGQVVETAHFDTLADGVAGGMDEDSLTLPLALEVVDDVVTCSEADISSALKKMAFDENQLVEGAAALALAGLIKQADQYTDQTNVVLVCGANFDREKIMQIILR